MQAPTALSGIYVVPGSEMLPHATASAKAILAFQPESVAKAALANPLPKLTTNTKTDIGEILAEYAEVRRNGYAVCVSEDVDGVGAVACPIRLQDVGVLYSVGITGTVDAITGPMDDHVRRLRGFATKLSAAIESGLRMTRAPATAEGRKIKR
jgi:DNA-binding IclR family transcriptional regulator